MAKAKQDHMGKFISKDIERCYRGFRAAYECGEEGTVSEQELVLEGICISPEQITKAKCEARAKKYLAEAYEGMHEYGFSPNDVLDIMQRRIGSELQYGLEQIDVSLSDEAQQKLKDDITKKVNTCADAMYAYVDEAKKAGLELYNKKQARDADAARARKAIEQRLDANKEKTEPVNVAPEKKGMLSTIKDKVFKRTR